MLAAMCLSIVFIIVDTCSVLGVFGKISLPVGIEPFWKVRKYCISSTTEKENAHKIPSTQISFIFKCLCNTIILDDFETAPDRIRAYRVMKQARMSAACFRTPAENNFRRRHSGGQPTSPTSPNGGYVIEVETLTRPEQARRVEERSSFSF